ncbi:MAG: hypothetical protein ACK58T_44995, partial [Phycisphaerae bacterium]
TYFFRGSQLLPGTFCSATSELRAMFHRFEQSGAVNHLKESDSIQVQPTRFGDNHFGDRFGVCFRPVPVFPVQGGGAVTPEEAPS